jgi:hypothetical protein
MKTRSVGWVLGLVGLAIFLNAHSLFAQSSVSVSASPSVITNEGEDSTITLTISPPSSRQIAVNVVLTGTAANGADFIVQGSFNRQNQVIVPAGQSTVTLNMHSLKDDDGRFSEFVVFNVIGGKKYRIGSPSHARVTIENVP